MSVENVEINMRTLYDRTFDENMRSEEVTPSMKENVKVDMKTLDDKSFDEKVRSEEPTPSIDENVKPDMKTLDDKSFGENVSSKELTPSMNPNTMRVKCEPSRTGKCIIHDCVMRQISVTTKKWRDRGKGRGFGYVSVKTPQFICSDRLKSRDT